ncbi:MAG: hypothetical protein AMXMBFR58_15900 [Phycisphaerae bacterium]
MAYTLLSELTSGSRSEQTKGSTDVGTKHVPSRDQMPEIRVHRAKQSAETPPVPVSDGLQNRHISRRISVFGPVAERQTQRT